MQFKQGIIIFGATGDLTSRKLIPAIFNLFLDGFLPESSFVLGCARTPLTDTEFRDKVFEGVKKHSRRSPSDEKISKAWDDFKEKIFFERVDGSEVGTFQLLKNRIEKISSAGDLNQVPLLFYLATAPEMFAPIAGNLKTAGLVNNHEIQRVIIEKPFGHDLPSSIALTKALHEHLLESQIFRIDHYLGKETVQNILAIRFANTIFEPLWNSKYIESAEISVCEDLGVEKRGAYFDKTGILRDIIQNHSLQMLSLLCIEPPLSLSDADSIRNEKVKVLKSIRPVSVEDAGEFMLTGQYSDGEINGEQVIGYKKELNIVDNSNTETYIAMKLFVDNWRFNGVPFYLRAGKRLPKRSTHIVIKFKQPPVARDADLSALVQNSLVIQVQPKEGASFIINSKVPGNKFKVSPIEMDFNYASSFDTPNPEAYERLLLDALIGKATLFAREDELEASWQVVEPYLEAKEHVRVKSYKAGEWGPSGFWNGWRNS